jgi:hypothetical protein
MSLTLVHRLHHSVELSYRDNLLFCYLYAPSTAQSEAPKPFFHPLRTLGGNEVTLARPHDHPWHVGLAMTSASLSGQNFWGGPTYVRESGYVLREDQGSIVHQRWSEMSSADRESHLVEDLAWIARSGETWIIEERRTAVAEIDPARGYWCLDLSFQLTNSRSEALMFGSPTTNGRPQAGYGGLFWRGPRSFLQGTIRGADGQSGPELMGRSSPWLAYSGAHDGSGDRSTLVFIDHPDNPRYPTKWFVRNDPYACVSASFMFDEEYMLEPGATLTLRYRLLLGNGEWPRQQIEAYVEQYATSP